MQGRQTRARGLGNDVEEVRQCLQGDWVVRARESGCAGKGVQKCGPVI